ncbi:helix-turn-helix transcriptional regulator [Streptomyces fuscigenes]|uniref:helix-turn-helix transcriptional regulator n=1 Tax=Streptomyces fuscigenes TaxID=1528880 RepID=UPI001F1983A6|nr:helix-turn-helix transcriptional regulator [Streptomyces fuscigenes]MCF3961885.1 helix-turn-helix transcriptional regulator [Streptomyces fuscigenes]
MAISPIDRTPAAPAHVARGGGHPSPDVRRRELAEFLRSRRERITPEQVGMARGVRRRTPGLRREEVAALSAVGVTWYTWLEQARDIQVSPQVLDALARALLLDPVERAHLFALGGGVDPDPTTPCAQVTPAISRMLEQLEPFPAAVQNSRYDILAYNSTYGVLLRDLDELAPEDRNCLWLAFTDEAWRASLVDREKVERAMAAKFRASMAEHLGDPAWKALLARLCTASRRFCEVWDRHEVEVHTGHGKAFDNAVVGRLRLEQTPLWLGPKTGPALIGYSPADEETRERLVRLDAHARELRAARQRPGAPVTREPRGVRAYADV